MSMHRVDRASAREQAHAEPVHERAPVRPAARPEKFSDLLRRRAPAGPEGADPDAEPGLPEELDVEAHPQGEHQGSGDGNDEQEGQEGNGPAEEVVRRPAPCPLGGSCEVPLDLRPRRPDPTASIGALAPEDGMPSVERLVETISELCNDPAVAEAGDWHVRLALRPDLLPRTTLAVTISSHWLRLRFSTDDADARHLLLTHRDDVVRVLDESLTQRREISILID